MSEQRDKPEYERKRKKCTFTLSDQAREFLKNRVTNASRFVDRLILAAENGIQESIVTVSPIESTTAEIHPPGRRLAMATSRSRGPQESRSASPESETNESLNDFYRRHKTDFISFLRSQKLTERTINDYINVLDRLQPVYAPPDIGRYEEKYGTPLSSKVEKAIGKLLRYVQVRHASRTLLGYDHDLWRMQFSALKATAEEPENPSRIKDLTPEEVRVGYGRLPADLKPFYAFLVYTGMRAEQAYDVLKSWNDGRVEKFTATVDGEMIRFCRYPTAAVSRGKKLSFYAFFPEELLPHIRAYRPPHTLSTTLDMIRTTATTNPTRPINVSNLRKFHVNALRRGSAVEPDVAEYIQGRRPKGVGATRYVSLRDLAVEQYPVALHRNMPDLLDGGEGTEVI